MLNGTVQQNDVTKSADTHSVKENNRSTGKTIQFWYGIHGQWNTPVLVVQKRLLSVTTAVMPHQLHAFLTPTSTSHNCSTGHKTRKTSRQKHTGKTVRQCFHNLLYVDQYQQPSSRHLKTLPSKALPTKGCMYIAIANTDSTDKNFTFQRTESMLKKQHLPSPL